MNVDDDRDLEVESIFFVNGDCEPSRIHMMLVEMFKCKDECPGALISSGLCVAILTQTTTVLRSH